MIIKRSVKFGTSNLKRCNVEDIDCEDDDACSTKAKKQKTDGYYLTPRRDFGKINGVALEDYGNIVDSCSTGVSCYTGEVESNSNKHRGRRGMDQNSEGYRPPLFKSSRGRVQVLPSRFHDTVINPWKKETSRLDHCESCCEDGETTIFDNEIINTGSPNWSGKLCKKQHLEDKANFRKHRIIQFSGKVEEREVGCTGLKDLDIRMYMSSGSSVTSVHEANFSRSIETGGCPKRLFNNEEKLEKAGNRKDFYQPHEFILGDIVWAKSGKKQPAWPAIVIDPWQASETVLRACVPGTICVMFFGYSKYGRVISFALPSFSEHAHLLIHENIV